MQIRISTSCPDRAWNGFVSVLYRSVSNNQEVKQIESNKFPLKIIMNVSRYLALCVSEWTDEYVCVFKCARECVRMPNQVLIHVCWRAIGRWAVHIATSRCVHQFMSFSPLHLKLYLFVFNVKAERLNNCSKMQNTMKCSLAAATTASDATTAPGPRMTLNTIHHPKSMGTKVTHTPSERMFL